MRLTPIEVRTQRFRRRPWGYDPREVEGFLQAVAADLEELVRENAELRRETDRLVRDLGRLREREDAIRSTLVAAQQAAEDLRRAAHRDAEARIAEAQLEAEKVLRRAEEARAGVLEEIVELRQLRARLRSELRRTLESFLAFTEDRLGSEEKPDAD